MASRRVDDLHPAFQPLVRSWEADVLQAGHNVLIYFTYRSHQEQNALYVQGREPLATVNSFRKGVGWAPISNFENRKVTNARGGASWHQYGLAFDFVPLSAGKPVWDYRPNDGLYRDSAELALDSHPWWVWGVSWHDYGHLEWHPSDWSVAEVATWSREELGHRLYRAVSEFQMAK